MKPLPNAVLVLLLASPAGALTLVDGGESDHVIVVAADAIPAERFAAEELASHLQEMSGAKLRIATDREALPVRAILVGRPRFLRDVGVRVNWEELGKEGYLLRVVGERLVIAGGRPRGTLYGVYALLEDHLGCRWFAPDTSVVPKSERVELPQLNSTGSPAFEYREPWMYVSWACSTWWKTNYDPDYVARTRNSGRAVDEMVGPVDARHGGHFSIPHCGHNLSQLVPAKEYAAENPDYFALHDGKRVTDGDLELCLTHPDVARVAAKRLREWMRADPEADMFFVGQSDTSNYCECERCRAAYTRYGGSYQPLGRGGLSGRNLEFLNKVAVLVADEFPSKRIGTFAYGNSRAPPKGDIKAHRNVVIWYCPIERCHCHAIDAGPMNSADSYDFPRGIRRWQEIARQVYAYDYTGGGFSTGFDLATIAPTVRAYRRMGVRGVMVDAIGDIQIGFGFLRYWLWAQSLNRPDWDAEAGTAQFLAAYYGAAAADIGEYIELITDPASYEPLTDEIADRWTSRQAQNRGRLIENCRLHHRKLTAQAIDRGFALFEHAREATRNDVRCQRHVTAARMSFQYAALRFLPGDDPRLGSEAARFLRAAAELEATMLEKRPIAEFVERVNKRRLAVAADWLEGFDSYETSGILDDQSPAWSGNRGIHTIRNHWSGMGAWRNSKGEAWGSAFRGTDVLCVTGSLYPGDAGGGAAIGLGDTNTAADGALAGNGQVLIRAEHAGGAAPVRLAPAGGWNGAVRGVAGLPLVVYDVRVSLSGARGAYHGQAWYRQHVPGGTNPWISMGSGPVHPEVDASHVCIGLYKMGRADDVYVGGAANEEPRGENQR